MFNTDPAELKRKNIFKAFSKPLDYNAKLPNILNYGDNVLFIWDNDACCLLTQGTSTFCSDYQQLVPTQSPEFEVSNILVNENGSRIALWGANGVAVIDLPWRCGPKLEYQDGKESIVVRCRIIEDLNLTSETEVVQVRWNLTSLNDSHLVVLVSDNTLYHFDMMPVKYLGIEKYFLGNRPFSRQRTLAALGDTAVDFCFAPILQNNENMYPNSTSLLVLRGNGDVNLLFSGSESEMDLEGQTLLISPLPEDNYLGDACAILTIRGKPSAVVLATTRGVIYHALLLPLDIDQMDVPVRSRRHRLLVIESLMIDLGLFSAPDDFSTFPLRLFADPGHPRRYFVVHPSGVHSVLLEALSGIEDILKSPNNGASMSVVEHLICTGRVLHGCTAFPYALLAIDSENNVIALPLRRIELQPLQLFSPEKEQMNDQGPLTNQMRHPFQQEIEQLLQESRVLPHIQLPRKDMPGDQVLAVIVRMTNLIHKVTFPKHRQVRNILMHRMQLIKAMRQLQLQELQKLEADRAAIQLAAEMLAEKVELISDNLEEQKNRVQQVIRHIAEANPNPTDAELRMQESLASIGSKINQYSSNIEKLKRKQAYQSTKIEEDDDMRDLVLSNKQASAIHSCLSVIGENIAALVRRVTEINDSIGLSAD